MKSSHSRSGHSHCSLILMMLFVISCSTSGNIQPSDSPKIDSEVEVKTETKAAIVGGLEALQKQLNYPEQAKQKGIETVLKAQVLVSKTGKVEQISFDEKTGYGFKEAARNAIHNVKFRAGKRNGKPIDMFITVPVTFEL